MPRNKLLVRLDPKQLLEGFVQQVNRRVARNMKAFEANLRAEIKRRLFASDAFQELLGRGQLWIDLGIADPEATVNALLDAWLSSIHVEFVPFGFGGTRSKIRGHARLYAIRRTYSEVLEHPAASFTSENGKKVEWLRWLIEFGDRVILRDFAVRTNVPANVLQGYSRTGEAIMAPAPGKGFRIDPSVSGTWNANFVTRSLEGIDGYIRAELVKLLR